MDERLIMLSVYVTVSVPLQCIAYSLVPIFVVILEDRYMKESPCFSFPSVLLFFPFDQTMPYLHNNLITDLVKHWFYEINVSKGVVQSG